MPVKANPFIGNPKTPLDRREKPDPYVPKVSGDGVGIMHSDSKRHVKSC
jgi:hypothetical protein